MHEKLKCPTCGHLLVSNRTHEHEDSKSVNCKKCGVQSPLGDWRRMDLPISTPVVSSPQQPSNILGPSKLPPPVPDSKTSGLGVAIPTSSIQRQTIIEHEPLPNIEIGVVATTTSVSHKTVSCPYGHSFPVHLNETGKQVSCPECGYYVLVESPPLWRVLVGLVGIVACSVILCAGCLSMLGDATPPTNSSYNSVNSDMDKFDGHFPNASAEERRLTQELYEQDSRSRGY